MYTNETNLPLSLSMFMVHSDYDHINEPNYISATSLLNSIKSIVLSSRVESSSSDVSGLQASAVGTASHDRLEKAFTNGNHIINMQKLGYPQKLIDKVVINPDKVEEGQFPIYLEKRSIKPLNGFRIGGKFDLVMEGAVRDLKTTKVFTWMKQDFDNYVLQGSIYRWLNPDIITENHMHIDFIFTDWKAHEVQSKEGYPPQSALEKRFNLMSMAETEQWIASKVSNIEKYMQAEEVDIPRCTDKELWKAPNRYAYYKKPDAKRATKVFDTSAEASLRLSQDGNVGRVETRHSEAKKCNYCNANTVCKQLKEMLLK